MRKLPLILFAGSILAAPAGSAQERPRETASEPRPLLTAGWLKNCQTQKVTGAGSVKTCLTYREHVDGNTGAVASVAIHQTGGRQGLMVTMPAWVERAPGVRVQIYPGSLWEKVQKGEPLDKGEEDRLKVLHLKYDSCRDTKCIADTAANAKLIADLKSNAGLIILAVRNGQSVSYQIPLSGLREAYD